MKIFFYKPEEPYSFHFPDYDCSQSNTDVGLMQINPLDSLVENDMLEEYTRHSGVTARTTNEFVNPNAPSVTISNETHACPEHANTTSY